MRISRSILQSLLLLNSYHPKIQSLTLFSIALLIAPSIAFQMTAITTPTNIILNQLHLELV